MDRMWPATICFVVLLGIPLHAQTPDVKSPFSKDDPTKKLTTENAKAALAAIEADTGITPEVKALLRPKYKQAIAILKEADDFKAKAADYQKALKDALPRAGEIRVQLKLLPSAKEAADVSPRGGIDDIQKDIEARRAALNTLQNKLDEVAKELNRVKVRPAQISVRLPKAQEELDVVRKQLAAPELAKDATSPGVVADRYLLNVREKSLLNELEMLKQEQLSQAVREELLQTQNVLLTRQVENAAAALESLNAIIYPRLTSDAKRIYELVRKARDNLPKNEADARAMAADVLALAQQYENVVEQLKMASVAQNNIADRLKNLTGDYERIQQQLKAGASGRAMVKVLLDLERRAASARSESALGPLLSPDDTRLASLKIDDNLREQSEMLKRFDGESSDALKTLLSSRHELLEKLQTQYGKLTRSVSDFETNKQRYLNKSAEVRNYLWEQLFWMRSSPPISFTTLTDIPDGLRWAFSSDHWRELAYAMPRIAAEMPVAAGIIVLIIGALLLRRRHIREALKQTGLKIRRVSTDRYVHTMQALFWTFLLAAPFPLLLGFTGWALKQNPDAGSWLRGVALGLRIVTGIAFASAFATTVCRSNGLGPAHFAARHETLSLLRRAIRRFTIVYIPSVLLLTCFVYGNGLRYLDSVGRISFILAHVWTAFVLWKLFHSTHGLTATLTREKPNRLMTRLRFVWLPLALACPLSLVVLAGAGYLITAVQLSFGFLTTMMLIGGGVLLYCLILRWFMIKERKLALAEALEKRRARIEQAESRNETDIPRTGESVEVDEEEELDLNTIGDQTRGLLQLVVIWVVAVVVFFFWSKALPLMDAFDDISIPLAGRLTLLSLLQAILIVCVTVLAVRNLPGLLELAVLRATNIEAGTRNAISTLCQYALVAIGIIMLFNVLRIDWAQFGWIAAGLSVGIGFGMQEVVANFVCGIILLFEQPIRVGDIVTIEGITGTVTKIHLRATTITNWDRQDFVVPNKTLITGTILNWTLSESINRIVIPVGVAYGTDTDKARRILLEAAADCSLVLKEPAPKATFEQFAENSLNLVLRAYLPNIEIRLDAITELHTEIDKRFAEAGIQIPFPQRDLHIINGNGDPLAAFERSGAAGKDD